MLLQCLARSIIQPGSVELGKASQGYYFPFFRTVVNGILAQVASNLRTSCEVTDDAFNKRITEVKFAKEKLEEQKSETIIKIQEVKVL